MKISILQITKDCNQNCFYCTRERNEEELSFQDIKGKIDSLDSDIEQIIITGGEPTLNKDLLDIIKYSKRKIDRIHLQTNGINLENIEFCKSIIDSGITSCLIALPSFDEDQCDLISSTKNILAKKIKAIENMSRFQNIDVGVVFVVNKYNYKNFPEYVNLISQISRDIYIQITYMIHYVQDIEKIRPKMIEYSKFIPFLDEGIKICKQKNMEYRIDGFPLCLVSKYLKNVSDLREHTYDFTQDFIDDERVEYNSDNYNGKEHIKTEICKDCKLSSSCKGIYEYYAKLFGTNELKKII